MKGMRALVVEAEAVDGVDGVKLELAAVDEIGESTDHRLAFELPFVAGAGGKADQRRAPVAVNDDAELHTHAMRIPAMEFTFHKKPAQRNREARVCQPHGYQATVG